MEKIIERLRLCLAEKAKTKHTRGRLVQPINGFNEILMSEFKRLLPDQIEPEEIDQLLIELQQAGYITKAEGVIIHLSKEMLLQTDGLFSKYSR